MLSVDFGPRNDPFPPILNIIRISLLILKLPLSPNFSAFIQVQIQKNLMTYLEKKIKI